MRGTCAKSPRRRTVTFALEGVPRNASHRPDARPASAAEIEEKQKFIDGVVEAAEKDGRDLTQQEMELVTRAVTGSGELNEQAKPMQEAARIAIESPRPGRADRPPDGHRDTRSPGEVEYRSAGEYVIDRWRAGLGIEEARERLELYHRAAAHMTTSADSAGILPEPIVGPVVNFVDAARPLVSALGPRELPGEDVDAAEGHPAHRCRGAVR